MPLCVILSGGFGVTCETLPIRGPLQGPFPPVPPLSRPLGLLSLTVRPSSIPAPRHLSPLPPLLPRRGFSPQVLCSRLCTGLPASTAPPPKPGALACLSPNCALPGRIRNRRLQFPALLPASVLPGPTASGPLPPPPPLREVRRPCVAPSASRVTRLLDGCRGGCGSPPLRAMALTHGTTHPRTHSSCCSLSKSPTAADATPRQPPVCPSVSIGGAATSAGAASSFWPEVPPAVGCPDTGNDSGGVTAVCSRRASRWRRARPSEAAVRPRRREGSGRSFRSGLSKLSISIAICRSLVCRCTRYCHFHTHPSPYLTVTWGIQTYIDKYRQTE
jgi:hypothetical protein